jgi:hypothetical protein
MSATPEQVLGNVSVDDFPIIAGILATDVGPMLREELLRLLARQWEQRAIRRQADVMARIRSQDFDEAVVIRNVSSSGVLVQLEPSSRVALNDGSLHLRVQTSSTLVDLPVAFIRVATLSQGRIEAAFVFDALDEPQNEALEDLKHLLYIPVRAVPAMNAEDG